MVPQRSQEQLSRLVQDLVLWTQEIFRIQSQLLKLDCKMADCGVVSHPKGPVVTPTDPLPLVRLKEKSISLRRTREKIHRKIEREGAIILNNKTMEILVPGGPTGESFLSWQPGEPTFLYFKKSADITSKRQPLPNLQHKKAALH